MPDHSEVEQAHAELAPRLEGGASRPAVGKPDRAQAAPAADARASVVVADASPAYRRRHRISLARSGRAARAVAGQSPVTLAGRRIDHEATLSAAIQILLPGESARPHRHSMNALRFVLEGRGGVTVVNGKECHMEFGDLILTPAWTWHEHIHRGNEPMIWLDALDVPLHLYLGTAEFQPGPVNALCLRRYRMGPLLPRTSCRTE